MSKRLQAIIFALCVFSAPAGWAAEVKGALQWADPVELSTLVSGTVDKVLVGAGSRVAKGQVLLRLDDRRFKADLAEAKANAVKAKDELDEAEKEVQRGQELFDRTVLSIHELQLVKIERARAEAGYRAAQAALQQARLNMQYSVVTAPYQAVVVRRLAQPGQTVVTHLRAVPLLVVARADRMVARAAVELQQIDRLKPGEAVTVRVGGRDYKGTVAQLGMEPVEATGQPPLYAVEVSFPVAADMLRAGQPATLMLP
ncbi:MAG: efflux RND transporter periplasmic adaptor subunit [Gammaproteobacteria bacterium]